MEPIRLQRQFDFSSVFKMTLFGKKVNNFTSKLHMYALYVQMFPNSFINMFYEINKDKCLLIINQKL